jgi:hypothetical protein
MLSINTNNNNLSVKSSTIVEMYSEIEIAGTNTSMKIKHSADFKDIPKEYHQIYFDAFRTSNNDTRVYDNTQPVVIDGSSEYNRNRIVELICNAFKRK